MTFASRQDAGRRLGLHLRDRAVKVDVVGGLPRGGVVVAAEVARILQCPLEVLVVRKIGHPWHREFAVGALAESGVVILDEGVVGNNPLIQTELGAVIQEETERLREYSLKFGRDEKLTFANQNILLVDDGLATGATTEAAVASARNLGAREIIVAVPVASTDGVERLGPLADGVIALLVDPDFEAVGRYYESFPQTSDDEVLDLLRAARSPS
jgi:putative phosphoribosyl transferase